MCSPACRRCCALVAATVALAGCGGAAKQSSPTVRTVTIPSYGGFPATTITGTDDPAACAKDGRAIVRDARLFLAHSGPAASYSADTYYIDLRTVYADFQVHGCTDEQLGAPLRRSLTPAQQRALVANLPQAMAQAVRDGLRASS